MNHFLVFPKVALDDKLLQHSKRFYSLMFNKYYKNYKHYLKNVCMESGLRAKNDKIQKLILLSLGFVYCASDLNYEKALFFFNLFVDDNGEMGNKMDVELFLYMILLTPSNVYLLNINDFSDEYQDDVEKLEENKFYEIYDVFQVTDSVTLLRDTLKAIFNDKPAINLEQFMKAIKNQDWLFSPTGIRHKLISLNKQES